MHSLHISVQIYKSVWVAVYVDTVWMEICLHPSLSSSSLATTLLRHWENGNMQEVAIMGVQSIFHGWFPLAKQRNKRVEGKLAEREKGDVVAVKGQDFSGIKKEGWWREQNIRGHIRDRTSGKRPGERKRALCIQWSCFKGEKTSF